MAAPRIAFRRLPSLPADFTPDLIQPPHLSPAAVAHSDLLADDVQFMSSLIAFHTSIGSLFSIPTVQGKALNMHLLYREVTGRGGYKEVCAKKIWNDVAAAFRFSPTYKSAIVTLKREYVAGLYLFEQVFFFRLPAPAPIPAGIPAAPPVPASASATMVTAPASDSRANGPDPATASSSSAATAPDAGPPSMEVQGLIDGQFDGGYLISFQIGSETMRGVMYQPARP